MKKYVLSIALLSAACIQAGCSSVAVRPTRASNGAQLFPNLGSHQRAVTTTSPEAQEFFHQGLVWCYAFNHEEAFRSFERAAQLDPGCAMAWWGIALSRGPLHNDPRVTQEGNAICFSAVQRALANIESTTATERALIEAMATRYEKTWSANRDHLNARYAEAMGHVWKRFPGDSDVGTLYAEAMMLKHPWDLYTGGKVPRVETPTIVAVLDRVMEMDPGNPGANHYYIHAVEGSKRPEDALPAADRLSELVPGSGHLQHMPTHIYAMCGQWDAAVRQNTFAVRADAVYRLRAAELGLQHRYMAHDAHMLVFSAMMVGREREAFAAAQSMWDNLPEDLTPAIVKAIDPWMSARYDVLKRFGRWGEILKQPSPPPHLLITTATWRANRAVAYAALKNFAGAEREFKAFRHAKSRVPADARWKRDLAHATLNVAESFIAGEIALHRGNMALAIENLARSAELEDGLSYSQPPRWMLPVRHALGAVYLTEGRYVDAERIYREDLARWKNNGWSLYGLTRALEGQGRTAEALKARQLFELCWKDADESTLTSCMCIPKT